MQIPVTERGLVEGSIPSFASMQTLVSPGCTKGFSPAFMWWSERKENPMLVVDSAWVFTIGILLVIFILFYKPSRELCARMLKAIATVTWGLIDRAITA